MALFTNIRKKFYYWHLVVALIIIRYVIITAIDYSQYIYISQTEVPSNLAGLMSNATWNQQRANTRFAFKWDFIKNFIRSATDLTIVGFGLLPLAWEKLSVMLEKVSKNAFGPNEVFRKSVIYYILYRLIRGIMELPLAIIMAAEQGKSVQLDMTVHTVVLPIFSVAVLRWVVDKNKWLKAGIIIGFYTVWQFLRYCILGPLFIPLQCDPYPADNLRHRLVALSESVGFPSERIFYISGMLNAFATGLGQMGVFVMGGALISMMEPDESIAVAGHELGHWKYCHSLIGWVADLCFEIPKILAFFALINRPRFYAAFQIPITHERLIPIGVGLVYLTIMFGELEFILIPLVNYVSWLKEYQADQHAVDLGYGQALFTGMLKMHEHPLALANLAYGLLHSTHPIFAYRLAAIKRAMGGA